MTSNHKQALGFALFCGCISGGGHLLQIISSKINRKDMNDFIKWITLIGGFLMGFFASFLSKHQHYQIIYYFSSLAMQSLIDKFFNKYLSVNESILTPCRNDLASNVSYSIIYAVLTTTWIFSPHAVPER